MAGPYTPHGRWSQSKGCPVWRACHGAPPSRLPRAALQGRLQARPQTHRYQHWKLGIACWGSQRLASTCAGRSQKRRGEEKQTDGREKNKDKQKQDPNPTTLYICNNCGKDCHARIGLLSHSSRCSQHHRGPTKALTIVSRDRRLPTTTKLTQTLIFSSQFTFLINFIRMNCQVEWLFFPLNGSCLQNLRKYQLQNKNKHAICVKGQFTESSPPTNVCDTEE